MDSKKPLNIAGLAGLANLIRNNAQPGPYIDLKDDIGKKMQ